MEREGSSSFGSGGSDAEALWEEFLRRREAGELDFEGFVQGHPEHEERLRSIAGWEARFEAALPAEGASGSLFHRPGVCAKDPPTRSMPVGEGVVLGDFRLVRLLGQGGMGQVWEAEQLSLERRVALKLIRPDQMNDEAVRLFLREARAGGRINHPGIAAVHGTGEAQGVHWIAQELVQGGCTLRDFLDDARAREKLPPDYHRRVARLVRDLADALACAHAAGVVHRDVKPGNVLVCDDDRPKITDFGLARLVDEGSLSISALRGTPRYMSPEQAGGLPVDHRTDVFSLGAVFYELLTLRAAFEGETHAAVLTRISESDPPDPRQLDPKVPRDLAVLAMAALRKRRHDRIGSTAELREELDRFLHHQPIRTRPPGPLARARMWVQRHPTASAVAGLAAAALLILALVWSGWKGRFDSERYVSLLKQAQAAIERVRMDGRIEEVVDLIDEAKLLLPEDHRADTLLAWGYSQILRWEDARAAWKRAEEKGFPTDAPASDAAFDHLLYGMYRFAGRYEGWDEAEQHLERAAALDAELLAAHFPLYQVRKALHDYGDALDALEHYRRHVAEANSFYPVVHVLRLELEALLSSGEERRAIVLEAIDRLERYVESGELSHEELRRYLNVERILGRLYLLADRLEEAERHLERAVEVGPEDWASLTNLARVHKLRYEDGRESGQGPEQQERRLQDLEQAAHRAWALDPTFPSPHQLLAWSAVERLDRLAALDAPGAEELRALAAERIEDLERVSPARAAEERARLVKVLESKPAAGSEELQTAKRGFQRMLAEEPDNVFARYHLAQRLYLDEGRWSEALREFQRARADWRPADGRSLLAGIHSWIFGCAVKLERWEVARLAREAMEQEITAAPAELDPADLLNFAEFLVDACGGDAEVGDWRRAHEIVESFELESVFAGHAGAAEILTKIRSAGGAN